MQSEIPAPPCARFDAVDALRGAAMAWMTFFHFSFDLANAGYTRQNFYADPLWTWQRVCILSLFLLCAGAGQAIASHQGQTWARFWSRWTQIGLCALLVSAGSALMFPGSWIYFGVLHGMALMLIVGRLTAGLGRWLWPMGLLAIGLKPFAAAAIHSGWLSPAFNTPWLNWLGLISLRPITEDYVPLVPWLGVLWWGMAATQWWLLRRDRASTAQQRMPAALEPLAVLGRWSLSYYMLHQPVMLAGLWAWAHIKVPVA